MKADYLQQPAPWSVAFFLVFGAGVIAVAVFFIKRCRSSSVQKHEYSALKTDGGSERFRLEKQVRTGIFLACKQYLAYNDRYDLNSQLCDIGSRVNKHWFTVQDRTLGAERLLTLIPLPSSCSINPGEKTKETLLELFRSLQHPYIHPILDIEFWDAGVGLIAPLNPDGSLRDLIYGALWHEDYNQKYNERGEGLPLKTIQCLGRQILEGNVIIQNGVARLAGLENSLLNLPPKPISSFETVAFGYLLFEMASGYELPVPPSAAHLQIELERLPQVADALALIFRSSRPPSLEEVMYCELFRGLELRELRGANVAHSKIAPDVLELLDLVRNPVQPSPVRRKDVIVVIEERRLEDILEEDSDDSFDAR